MASISTLRAGARRRPTLVASLVVLVALVVLPQVVNFYYVQQVQILTIYALLAAGLAVAVNYTGLLSIGHGALMAVGGYAAAYLAVEKGWPFPLTLVGAVVASAAVGLVLATPSGRLTHMYFAMITLGLALTTEQLLIEWKWTGSYSGIYGVPAASIGSFTFNPVQFFYLVVVLTALVLWMLSNLMRSRFGRSLLMVRDDEVAAASSGIRPYSNKLWAFVISSLPAGLAGGLFAYVNAGVTPGTFNLNFGLFLLLAVVVGGRNSILGPIGGVLLLFAVPIVLREYETFTNILFGVLLLIVMALEPGGLSVGARRIGRRLRERRTGTGDRAGGELAFVAGRELPDFVRADEGATLEITGVRKTFGGLVALDDVSTRVRPGAVTAIIGPNGSGKTTLLNIISGFYRREAGQIAVGDSALPSTPASIARRGIGRTFQTPKVLADQPVLDSVMAGYAAAGHSTMLESALRIGRGRRDEVEARTRALALLDYMGLAGREDDLAGDLPHPHQRFLEIARALMVSPRFLLLDEPAAGLSSEEVAHLDRIVRDLAERGVGVAIVEHNIGLVLGIADQVVVVDTGKVIADGDARSVQQMPEVASIYLGEEWVVASA